MASHNACTQVEDGEEVETGLPALWRLRKSRTLLVERIPAEFCSNDSSTAHRSVLSDLSCGWLFSGLSAYFNSVFGREVVEITHVTRKTQEGQGDKRSCQNQGVTLFSKLGTSETRLPNMLHILRQPNQQTTYGQS